MCLESLAGWIRLRWEVSDLFRTHPDDLIYSQCPSPRSRRGLALVASPVELMYFVHVEIRQTAPAEDLLLATTTLFANSDVNYCFVRGLGYLGGLMHCLQMLKLICVV